MTAPSGASRDQRRERKPCALDGKQLEPILTDWRLPEGGLCFVTPTARARPAKVSALADFFITKLGTAEWSAEAVMGWKQPNHRRK